MDIVARAAIGGGIADETIQGNLLDLTVCRRVMHGVTSVLHFAANMGGMGTIHSDNDAKIYADNHRMTMNILQAAFEAGVITFFYASSACVYPECLQGSVGRDVSLAESDVWLHRRAPHPQGLYGQEKLNGEQLVHNYRSKMQVRVARYHNVYGDGGTWYGGREKAPAAFLRKALACKLLGPETKFEIWGNGQQRRSFLWIGDAVDGTLALLKSSSEQPTNIGCDQAVSILDLARLALRVVSIDPGSVHFQYDETKPLGVASRNSDNTLAKQSLGWEPATKLEDGMKQTAVWVESELRKLLADADGEKTTAMLRDMQASQMLSLESEPITFAILLPITSRRSSNSDDCLVNLGVFAHSLVKTTRWDTQGSGEYRVVIYLVIDHDDHFLRQSDNKDGNRAADLLRAEGLIDVHTIISTHPPGRICHLWRDSAAKAYEDGADYLVLMGDDVKLNDEGWMKDCHERFLTMAEQEDVPVGFGCVAFTDTSFPGMPTFPVVNRTHMDMFSGSVVPEVFVNQDGDPFLFQLYRRWGCAVMMESRISNRIGGKDDARYTKIHVQEWTYRILDDAVDTAKEWLAVHRPTKLPKLTLDVIIPCYRVDMSILNMILQLKPSPSCAVMFIIIIDNPNSPSIAELEARYGTRPDVRIRVNKVNSGASVSRNRGLEESSAEWVHFLDDDINPQPDILVEVENIIRQHPNAAGFVGNARFPCANTVFLTAVHLAGVTYFWDIADKMKESRDLPWGVTANLVARRNKDDIRFDKRYPKTGGGEDIAFCREKRDLFLKEGDEGFVAAPKVVVTHPWWNKGLRSYWRFYMWSLGDGALIHHFPKLTYSDFTPNFPESLLLCALVMFGAALTARWGIVKNAAKAILAVILANVLHDMYRHIWKHPERNAKMYTSIRGGLWALAVIESSFIRIFSETGRLRGVLGRREFASVMRRFDWFAGGEPNAISEERMNGLARLALAGVILGVMLI